ncbi:hypothetical protein ACJX0J_011529, partial [Zea mays]
EIQKFKHVFPHEWTETVMEGVGIVRLKEEEEVPSEEEREPYLLGATSKIGPDNDIGYDVGTNISYFKMNNIYSGQFLFCSIKFFLNHLVRIYMDSIRLILELNHINFNVRSINVLVGWSLHCADKIIPIKKKIKPIYTKIRRLNLKPS